MSKVLRTVATIAASVALIATGVGAAAGAAGIAGVASGATLSTIATAASLTAGVAGAVSNLTAPKPIARGSPAQVVIAAEPPRPYIVGQVMTGGVLRHDVGYGATRNKVPNPFRWQVRVLSAGGGIQGIVGEFFDFAPINNGYFGGFFNSTQNLGQRPQAAALVPPYGPAPGWDASSKISGSAHVGLNFLFDKDGKRFASGLPIYTALCDGEKAYDPRQDSTFPGGSGPCRLGDESTYVYSGGNPAIEAAMYAYGRFENGKRIFGLGQPADTIDWPAVVDWANDCDANGWRANIILQEGGTDANLREQRVRNLDDLCAAGGGRWYQAGGLLSFDWHRPRIALATLTDADILQAGGGTDAVPTVRERMNGVRPQYVSPQHNWQMITAAEIVGSTYRAEDGQPLTQVYPLNGVTNVEQAGELASYAMADSRELGPMDVQAVARWRFYRPGDCIQVNSSLIAYQGQAVINQRSLDPETFAVSLSLKSETPGKHDFALGKVADPPPTPILAQTPEERDLLVAANITPRAVDVEYDDGTPVEALKPAEDGATRGAPIGTDVAGLPAEVLVEQAGQAASEASAATIAIAEAQQDIADLFATYGSTASAAQSAAAAAASQSAAAAAASTAASASSVAQSARDNAQAARDQAQAARDLAQSYQTGAQAAQSAAQTASSAASSARSAAEAAQAAAITQASNAAASASAANTSASNASSSASAASSSASAASASATQAASQASQAGVYASQAATSASDAAGHSSSAFSSSQVAAGARDAARNTLARIFPPTLEPDSRSAYRLERIGGFDGPAQPAWGWPQPYLATAQGTEFQPTISPRYGIPTVAGRRYRAVCWVWANIHTLGDLTASVVIAGNSGVELTNWEGTVNPAVFVAPGGAATGVDPLPVQAWVKLGVEYVAEAGWPAFHRPLFVIRRKAQWDLPLSTYVHFTGIEFEDITSEHQAALSASASASSASSAAASQTAANQSASAAQTSATNASTSAAQAATSASSASTSATNAAGSASTAATQATNAANSASAAAGSASAASGSASMAATHASNAATSASAAQNSATSASTSAAGAAGSANSAFGSANDAAGSANSAFGSANAAAGSASSASTSAGQASTSASNAAGSAASAASNASVAASARDGATQALQATFPQFLSPETMAAYQMDGAQPVLWGPGVGWPVPYISHTPPNTSGAPANTFKKGIAAIPGKRYRVTCWLYTGATNNPWFSIWLGGSTSPDWGGTWGSTFGSFTAESYAFVFGCVQATFASLPQNQFVKVGVEFRIPDSPPWGFWRPIFQVLGNADGSQLLTGGNTHISGITVEDITSEFASKGFADASSSSASSAAASQSAAANSASAAQTSATNAATSAGTAGTHASNAGTAASNAATSASNAVGSASTASTQAGNAANSATNAANSASAAANSASTAASQATLAGQSASAAQASQVAANSAYEASRDAAAQALPFSFTPSERQFWIWDEGTNPGTPNTGQYDGTWFGGADYPVFATRANQSGVVASRGSFVPVPGRTYRTFLEVARVQDATNGRPSQLYFGLYREDGGGGWQGVIQYADGLALPTGWQTLTYDWVADSSLWWARPRLHWNWNGGAGGPFSDAIYHVRRLQVVDVTETLAAASSASAAATSASQAATSANSAGSSATSASNSANNASTSAGTASSSASAASGSAASAASSASNAASNAASSQTFANQSASFRDQAQSHASNAAASASSASASESSAANFATLSAQFQGASNLLTNTDFASGLDGWEWGALQGASLAYGRNYAGDSWRPIPENQFGIQQYGRVGSGEVTGFVVQRVPAEPGVWMQVSAWIAAHRCNVNVGVAWQDANFNWLPGWFFVNPARANGGQNLGEWSRVGITSSTAAPPGTRYAVFHLYKYDTDAGQSDSYAWFCRPQVSFARQGQTLLNHYAPGSGRATAAALSAAITAESSARASAIAAEASARSALAATVTNQGASITQQSSAIATLQSQAASFEQRMVAGTANALRNGSFELGNTTFWAGNVGFSVDQGSLWGTYAGFSHPTGASGWPLIEQSVPWPEQHWLTASASLNAWATAGDAVTYVEVLWINASNQEIPNTRINSPQGQNAWFGSTDNRNTHKVTGLAPVGTVRAIVRLVAHSPSGTLRFFGIRQVKAEAGTTATPYSNEATVNYQAGVIADHTGKLQAYAVQSVSAGQATASIRMVAKDGAGNPTSSIGLEAQEIVVTNPVGNAKRVAMRLSDGVATFGGDVVFGGRLLFANGLALRLAVQPHVMQVHDGQSIIYPNAGYLPVPNFQVSGLAPLAAGETYNLYLENQTAGGATVRLKINVPGVPANYNLTSDTAWGAGNPERILDKAGNPDAIGNSYTVSGNFTVGANPVLEGVNYWIAYFSATIEIYARVGGSWIVIDTINFSDSLVTADGSYTEMTSSFSVQVTAPSGVTHFGADASGPTGAVVTQITSVAWTAPGTPGTVRSASPNGEKCQLSLNY